MDLTGKSLGAELASVFDHAPVIMLLIDADRRVVCANRAAGVFARCPAQALAGRPVREVLGCLHAVRRAGRCGLEPDCATCALNRTLQDLWSNSPLQSQASFTVRPPQLHEGKPGLASLVGSAALVQIRGTPHTLLCIEDVTEKECAQERVREQAALLEIAHDAITVLDLEGRVLYWNPAAEKLYGWPVEEALGKTAGNLFFEEIPPEFVHAVEKVIKQGEWSGEFRQTHRGGKPVVVHCRANLVRDAAGKAKSMLLVSTDVTENKALEARLLRVQRLETIGTLASGIAHDLNNILAPISMAVEVLRLKPRDDHELMLLQILTTSTQRGAGIVKQLLSFSRGVEVSHAPLRPKALVKEMGKIVQETFPKSIRLNVDIPDDIWDVKGDPTQIHQVLLNLCVNARDAMPQGGVLTITGRNTRLDEAAVASKPEARPGAYITLEVRDTGSGMTEDVLAKIFTPFFTTKPVGHGTGLGLSTVRDIARCHGGFVQVDSQLGHGSSFTIFLPAASASATGSDADPAGSGPLGHGELVLLVDDEQSVLKLAKHVLETHGYGVLAAQDGREALAVFARHQTSIQVVILDLMMPNLDGPEAIRTLRSMDPHLPILAISGTTPREATKSIQTGKEIVFLPKPFTVQHLLEALHRALQQPRAGFAHL